MISWSERKNRFLSPELKHYNEGAGGDAMVRHIDSELQALKDLALQMGGCVEKSLENACKTITTRDSSAGEEVRKHEARINDLQILIDESCVNVLAKQAPVAKDLRLVFAINKINTDLERMGDQAVNIVYSGSDIFRSWPEVSVPAQITDMIEEVRGMVRSVLDAFARRDVDLSQKVLEKDDMVDELKDVLIREMKAMMKADPHKIELYLAFIMIAKNLERMADHATNIAEEVIYLATGNDVRHGHSVSAGS